MLVTASGFGFIAFAATAIVSGGLSFLADEGQTVMTVVVLGLSILLMLIIPVMTGGIYSHIGVMRAVRGGLLSDILAEACVAVAICGQEDATSIVSFHTSVAICFPFWFSALVAAGKPPFDFGEAESELVAGSMTELSGGVFAFGLMSEGGELIALIGWILSLQVSGLPAI